VNRFEVEKFDAAVVVVGSLNPAITTPEWLLSKHLISQGDCEAALASLQASVPQGVISYHTDWFALNVVQQKLSVLTKQGSTPRIRDLVAGIFHFLAETPATAIGTNFHADVRFHSASDYYLFGDVLAPKEVWHRQFPASEFAVGVKSLTMEISRTPRPTGFPDAPSRSYRNLTIEPSGQSIGVVTLRLNIHDSLEAGATGRDVAELLLAAWEGNEAESKQFLEALVANVLESVE
jgi:hypothetical protein